MEKKTCLQGGDQDALERFIGAENLEDRETQYHLSVVYAQLFHDEKRALEWLSKAAEQAHEEALFQLGEMYAQGKGLPQDDQAACACYTKAINKGHVGAQFELGLMYASGRGVPQDNKLALRRLKKAAEGGHVEAQFYLGKMYCEGRGVVINKPWGCKLLQRAGSQGHEEAAQLYQQISGELAPKRSPKVLTKEEKPQTRDTPRRPLGRQKTCPNK